jgi:NhaC family Na+:H+ antiporter
MTESLMESEKRPISLRAALIPVVVLIGLLAYNIFIFGDGALSGSNQFILLMGGAVAAVVGFVHRVSYTSMMDSVAQNVRSTTEPILILLLVGALSGTWMISGIIPSMIYYGLQLLSPSVFLAVSVVICAVISVATGSSWSTSATIGIALIGIGQAMDIDPAMTAGAVLSGAYFGDKLSPLSDTTNLAAAMAGSELFSHIRYMLITTVPSITIALGFFLVTGMAFSGQASPDITDKLEAISTSFHITPWLFAVPVLVIVMIMRRTKPLIALLAGALMGGLAAIFFQPDIVMMVAEGKDWNASTAYKGVMNALTVKTSVITQSSELNDLFVGKGMEGMLGTIWLIICAMVFGGIMDAIGALDRISQAMLSMFSSVFGLFASTVASCLAINFTASDQYLSIVVPGKMFDKAYREKNLSPENLSRTLEDSGTVTSVLIPWNTCAAYNAGVLGVPTFDYFVYAVFNWVSPFMTLLVAGLRIKIKTIK